MLKTKGKNQTMVRQINRRLVINILAKGAASCTDIANELKLSNTAVSKIISELRDCDLVTLADTESQHTADNSELGRKPILYALTRHKHMTGVVNLAENAAMLVDITGQIISERQFEKSDMFTGKMLENLIHTLGDLCAAHNNVHLVAVCVVTFGLLDSVTGEYVFANRFENFKGINLVNIFKSQFGVPVHVINDAKVNLIAEQKVGLLTRATNAVLLQVDTGIAAALMLSGVNYGGEQGFSGEAGLMTMPGGSTLEDCAGITRIERTIRARIRDGEKSYLNVNCAFSDIAKAYADGDALCCAVVDESARVLAVAIKNIIHLLDAQVVICGRVVCFGERYLSILRNEIEATSYITRKIQFSELPYDEISRIGSSKLAVEIGFDNISFERIREKTV